MRGPSRERLLGVGAVIKGLIPRIPDRPGRREILRTVPVIVGSGLGLNVFAGCLPYYPREKEIEAQRKALEEVGMKGEHPVLDLRSIPGFSQNGSIGGGFFVFTGEFQGKTTMMLQFAWKIKEQEKSFQISQIPLDRVQFKTADPDKKPTVEFEIDEVGLGKLMIIKGDRWVPQTPTNINDYVGVSKLAIISLSETDYTDFRNPRK